MARIDVQGFGGIRPRISPHLLGETEAVTASNARLESGDLYGWNLPSTVANLVTTLNKTIYHFGDGTGSPIWMKWITDVDVARSPVPGDASERTYYTGDGVPKGTNATLIGSNSWFALGVPAALTACAVSAPLLSTVGAVTEPLSNSVGRIYVPPGSIAGFGGAASPNVFVHGADDLSTQTVNFTEFARGLVLLVTAIVDANNVTLGSAVGAEDICGGEILVNWHVLLGTYGTNPVDAFLRMPNGMNANITAHGLRVGDILTVDVVTTTPQWVGSRGNLVTSSPSGLTGSAYANFNPYPYVVSGEAPYAVHTVPFTVSGAWTFLVTRNENLVSARSYVYTWVTDLGEESAPSPPTATVIVNDADAVVITGFASPPSVNRTIQYLRIYRTAVGTNATDFQFVVQLAADATTYTDSLHDSGLGEVLATDTWDPPITTMAGISASPNGFLVGFSDNIISFSEPYYPHAWPVEYRQTTDYPIVGMAVVNGSVFTMTKGSPYVSTGSHPRNMSQRRLAAMQACVSKRSIAAVGNEVFYASPDGLVQITPSGQVSVVTREWLTRVQWQAYSPATMVAREHNGMYIAFYDGGSAPTRGAFIFDPAERRMALVTSPQYYLGAYAQPSTGELFVTDGQYIYLWDGGAASTFTWRSKLFDMEFPQNMAAVRVMAAAYPVTFTLINGSDGSTIATRTIANETPVRLPAGKLYTRLAFSVAAASSAGIQRVTVGESMQDCYAP